jgi:carboxypeptidase C (cathepsin A)
VLDRAVPVWTSAFVSYVRQELGYVTDLHYRLLSEDLAGRWDYGTGPSRQGYADAVDDLLAARAVLPTLRVLIAHGRTDLVTPYFATRYLLDQMPAMTGSPAIELEVYAGGHMMYMNPASRRALAADAARLYRRSLAGEGD